VLLCNLKQQIDLQLINYSAMHKQHTASVASYSKVHLSLIVGCCQPVSLKVWLRSHYKPTLKVSRYI